MPRYLCRSNGRAVVITSESLKTAEREALAAFEERYGFAPDEELGDEIQVLRVSARGSHDTEPRKVER